MGRSKREAEEVAPSADYHRAARYFAEGRTREEVEALCPGVDLHHPSVATAARAIERADKARHVDHHEIRRLLLEIADDEETPLEMRVQILLKMLDH